MTVFRFVPFNPWKGAQVNAKNNNGWTALMWASDEGHADVVQLLLDRGQCAH